MGRLKAMPPRLSPATSRLAVQSHAGPDREQARALMAPWRAWYKTAAWRALRLKIFVRDLFTCQMRGCNRIESDTSRLMCDHIQPHRGDETLFWSETNLQTLCKPCHDRVKQAEERRHGYR